jgi:hypothetical protein
VKTKGAIKNGQPEQHVASCSGLSIFDCPFGFLSMLPIALVCPFLIAPLVFSLCCQLLWFVHFLLLLENQRGN